MRPAALGEENEDVLQEMGLVLETKLLHDEAEFEDVRHVHA